MYILKLELTHFGKFHLKTIHFTPGLNVVYGKNEAGKSTIHAFVRSMLFGIGDTPEGQQRYQRYLPWDNPEEYGGKLWICKDEMVYRIQRSFIRGQESLQLVNETEGVELEAPAQKLRQLLGGLTETHYLNTICIEQLEGASGPQLAEELQKLVRNTSQSKNMQIDVDRALQKLSKRKQELEACIGQEAERRQEELCREKKRVQTSLSHMQKLCFTKESQRKELTKKLELEVRAADENMLSYERERDALRRRYEADQKAWDNAPSVNPEQAEKKPCGWIAMLLLTIFFGAGTAALFLTRGLYSDMSMVLVSACLSATVICFVGIFVAYVMGKHKLQVYRDNCRLSQTLRENLEESLKAFEECKARAPRNTEETAGQLQAKLDQLDRELVYLKYQIEEEQKLRGELVQKEKQLIRNHEKSQWYQEELEAVNMAMDRIRKVSVRIHDTFGNLLNTEASKLLFRLTNGRYDRLVIDPEGSVMLYNEEHGVALSSVSRGTVEQIYLCIRMAAAQLLWKKEPMPFLFDDVFAYYDDERIEEAIGLLKDCGHQAIIFSCHTREDSLI